MPEEVVMKLDATQAAEDLRAVVSEVRDSVSYELESAIERTAFLLSEEPGKYVFDRLAAHFDKLLAEQLRQVSLQPLPVIE